MSKKDEARRCKVCGKLLLPDDKVPLCRRCILESRNKAGKISVILGSLALAAQNAFSLLANDSEEDDEATEDDDSM